LSKEISVRAAEYALHPVLLDAALHVFSAGAKTIEDRRAKMKLPVRFARILFLRSPGASLDEVLGMFGLAQACFASYEAVGLVSLGMMLFALYLVLVVVLGRTGRTEFSFPATVAGTAANVGLNLFLIPRFGIVGAGVALVCSYAITLAIMFVVTQRLFPVPYEWPRLLQVLVLASGLVVAGTMLTPIDGIASFAIRLGLLAAYPAVLFLTGFLHDHERAAAVDLLRPSAVLERLSSLRAVESDDQAQAGGRGPTVTSDVIEAESRDEDAIT
jgi:hypothetical protein